MPHCRRIRLAILLATCLTVTEGLWAQLKAGVVVESVAKYSEGEKAGLQEGDVLTTWSRGEAKGELQSPFDLSLVEIEQAPRGKVTLEGLRGAEQRSWVIGPDEWRLKTRLALAQDLLATYLEGRELAKAGNLTQSADRWRAAAAKAQNSAAPWANVWLLFHTAETFADARQWKEADEAFRRAVQEENGADPPVNALIFRAWAAASEQHDDFTDAENYYQLAANESQKLNTQPLLAAANFESLGDVLRQDSKLDKAEEYCHRALVIQRELAPDSLPVTNTLITHSLIDLSRGDLTSFDDHEREALRLRQKLAPESLAVANALFVLGIATRYRGDLAGSEVYEQRALAIQNKLAPGSLVVASTLNELGNTAFYQGAIAKAEQHHRRALAIREKLAPGSYATARSFNNLGNVAWGRGDLVQAKEYFTRALAIEQRVLPNGTVVAIALMNLGAVTRDLGDDTAAERYVRQALSIQERLIPNSVDAANTLDSLADVFKDRGDLAKAQYYYRQALGLREKLAPDGSDTGESLLHLGELATRAGDLAEAEEYCRKAAAIFEKRTPKNLDHAESLAVLAGIMRRKQQPDAAHQFYQQALDALEGHIARLGGGEDLRSQFRAKRSNYYKDYVDLLVNQKETDIAFQVLERLHARTLLEILAAAHIDIHQGVNPSLLEEERALQQSFNAKSNRRVQLLGDKHTDEQLAALDKDVKDVLGKYQDVEEQIRAASPTYTALTQPKPLSAKEIQQQLLDPTTLLLEYSLGEDRSYVFVVNPDSLTATPLPKRATIERLARQVYSSLTARNSRHKGDTFLEWQARATKAEAEYPKLAGQLSQMILGPVAAQLKGKRLLIVSDGALHYIPFAALPEPQPLSPAQAAVPLMVHHEIVNLPSASVLSVLRAQHAGRTKPPKLVAVLADPVFDNQDARLHHPIPSERNASDGATRGQSTEEDTQGQDTDEDDFAGRQLTRSATDIGLQEKAEVRFPRLQLTRREAQDILAVTPAGQGIEALDFNASRASALDPGLAQYRIVHFATHGLLDSQHPELSGLVLSLVNEHGKRQNGFLGLQDIYNMNLSADLVVLSACETGLGKEVEGEGLLSLTRGFMYAGAPRVVASLWKIDDLATASLMKEFYKAMEQQRTRPAAALRHAQLEMWKTHRWSAPYYWAAFQIQGEWK